LSASKKRLHIFNSLPLHVCQESGETCIKPCDETQLTEKAAETLLDKSFMPLLFLREKDMIRLARFQSLALPPKALARRWEMMKY